MRALKTVIGTGFAVAFISFATACTLASPSYYDSQEADKTEGGEGDGESSGGGESSTSGEKSTGIAGATCGTDDFVKPDLSKLTACGNGKGHCYDKDKSPMNDQFGDCPGEAGKLCVPDDILTAGGGKLKACKSLIGEGGCGTVELMPKTDDRAKQFLKQDACAAGQLCFPCTDPEHGDARTGFCDPIGVHEKACSATPAPSQGGDGGSSQPTALAGCCTTKGKSNGTCLPEAAIPEDQRGDTKQDSCASGNKCVPTAFYQNKPVKCDTGIPFIEKGVCLDKCFDSMLAAAGTIGALSRDKCGSTELCVPCKALEGQGAPGCE